MRNETGIGPGTTLEDRRRAHAAIQGSSSGGPENLETASHDALRNASAKTGSMSDTPERGNMAVRQGGKIPGTGGAPAQRDVLNHANFGLLPEEKGRLGSFGVAAIVNVVLVLVLIAVTINQVHEATVHRQEQLTYLAPEPKPYVPPVPKIKMPPPPVLPKEEPRIVPPTPVITPPKVELPKMEAKAPAMPAPAPRPVVTPPRPVLGAFKSPQAPAAQAPRVAAAQAAGFGAPTGVHSNPDANRPSQLASVGAFGAASNSDQGAASRRGAVATTGFGSGAPSGSPNGSARGVAVSTGFGSGSQPAGQPGGHGSVASTGFGAGSQPGGTAGGHGTIASTGFGAGKPAATAAPARAQEAAVTPIIVLAKPLPQYTAEARAAHIEGDVTLEVRFTAQGQVEVLRVVSGLGHGLDEQARLAAERIRFKPATRDGKPVDQVSVIHVAFQLA
jgi:TonB family protein